MKTWKEIFKEAGNGKEAQEILDREVALLLEAKSVPSEKPYFTAEDFLDTGEPLHAAALANTKADSLLREVKEARKTISNLQLEMGELQNALSVANELGARLEDQLKAHKEDESEECPLCTIEEMKNKEIALLKSEIDGLSESLSLTNAYAAGLEAGLEAGLSKLKSGS